MSKATVDISTLSPERRALLELRLSQKHASSVSAQAPITRQSRSTTVFPLSFSQQRIWFMQNLEPLTPIYNIRNAVSLSGLLDVSSLQRAFSEVFNRHDVLRTLFPVVDQQPMQAVQPAQRFNLEMLDLTSVPDAEKETKYNSIIKTHGERPFKLANEFPIRALLIRLADDEHILSMALHHIVFDGWSMDLLIRELGMYYQGFSSGQSPHLPELPIQYVDYALWQRRWLQGPVLAAELEYWRGRLEGISSITELPYDHPRPVEAAFSGAKQYFQLQPPAADIIRRLGQQEGATPFITMLAIFNVLLQRYTGKNDVVVATSIANRSRAETEFLIGPLLNILVLRNDTSGDPSFRSLLRRVRDTSLEAYAHQDLPFDKVVEELQPERHLNRTPLVQVAFALLGAQTKREAELAGVKVTTIQLPNRTSKFDLSVLMHADKGTFAGTVEYSTELFEASTIQRLIGHLRTLAGNLVANPDRPISTSPMLTDSETIQVLRTWNNTAIRSPLHQSIAKRFEDQVERSPEAPAMRFGPRQMTYAELNRKANQLARYLVAEGIGPERVVGICMRRSFSMLVAILAVVKAGAAYLPLDPVYPVERLRYMIEDSAAAFLLVDPELSSRFSGSANMLSYNSDDPASAHEAEHNCEIKIHPDNAAYVIYTSGSTGRPKGVVITHRGLENYLGWCASRYCTEDGTGIALHTSIAFDLTVTALLPGLLAGKTLDILPEEDSLEAFCQWFTNANDSTLVKITPAHLEALEQKTPPNNAASHAKFFVIGGEALLYERLAFWRRNAPEVRLVNEYGPTETVVGSSVYEVLPDDPHSGPVPIGKPLANTSIYILDADMNPVPVGIVGEIYIGGAGLARCYVNRPALTAEKFVPNPFGSGGTERLYRTGDSAKYRADGNIEFLGRRDDQIKVRGHRIELGELEIQLSQYPGVEQAVVIAREDVPGEKRLIAYSVLETGCELTSAELADFLKARVPAYMVPGAFVFLPKFPLTWNGKVDKRSLPAPGEAPRQANSSPRSEDVLELQLIQIWEDLLNVRPISRADNFFELGGHSLLAIRLTAVIQRRFGQNVALSDIFRGSTVAHLADVLRDKLSGTSRASLVAIKPTGSSAPLFLVHPGNGSAACFEPLAKYLSPDQPLYAFEAPHPVELNGPDVPVDERAAEYIAELQRIQPEGPYFIGGYSFGSVVAFEMACQLERQGHRIGLVALLDGGSPSIAQRTKGRSDAIILAGVARDLARESGVSFSLTHGEIACLSPEQAIQVILDRLKRSNILPPEVGPSWVARFLEGTRARISTVENYSPGIYPGTLTLFRSTEREPESTKAWMAAGIDANDEMRGWDSLSTQPVQVEPITGYHSTMLKEPYVQIVAQKLQTYTQIDAIVMQTAGTY
ncbi:MAG TPA: amino acid adenylation domain-containing protein [Bryobacteraceae bacterium]|nr:amino acid adenylation domain-containing protein [Bryobacteraceae bacterium]